MANPNNLFFEGFDRYNDMTALDAAGIYGLTPDFDWTFVAGRYGGKAIKSDSFASGLVKTIAHNPSNVSVGFALRLDGTGGFGATSRQVLALRDGSGNVGLAFSITQTLQLHIFNGVSSEYLHAPILGTASWHYIEARYLANGTNGVITAYLDGAQIYSRTTGGTNGAMTGSQIQQLYIGGSPVPGSIVVDDLYLTDATAVLGPCRVEAFVPTSEFSNTGFTAVGAATTWEATDELIVAGLGDYAQGTAVNDKVLFDSTNTLSSDPAAIHGVRVLARAGKSDAGSRFGAVVLRSNTTEQDGTSIALSDTNQMMQEVWHQNPDGNVSWTRAAVEAAKFGFKVTA